MITPLELELKLFEIAFSGLNGSFRQDRPKPARKCSHIYQKQSIRASITCYNIIEVLYCFSTKEVCFFSTKHILGVSFLLNRAI